jgi:hypothetical protein
MQVNQPQGGNAEAITTLMLSAGQGKTRASNYASRTADKFVLRMPEGMRSRIENLASEGHRSMNAEMIMRLERSFIDTDVVAQQTLLIQQLSARIHELEQQREVAHG